MEKLIENDELIALVNKLTEAQKIAIVSVDAEGNGKHIWQIHYLIKCGLMSFMKIENSSLDMAYRLNENGKIVKSYLIKNGYHD